MNNCAITQEFSSYLKHEKHFSEHTAKCYGADLEQFSQFLISGPQGSSNSQESFGHTDDQLWPSHSGGTAIATETKTEVKLE